jgi:hypothetical protein
LDKGATVLVLSRGIAERLQVDPATLKLLERRGVPVHILQSEKAVRLFNELRETEPVGGLFHTTC